jgi:tetratricopeptide (TPR) repeat protein
MSVKKAQVLLLVSALVLFVLLFIAPKIAAPHDPETDLQKPQAQNIKADNDANLDVYLNLAVKNLKPAQKTFHSRLAADEKTDSLALFWDRLKRPDLAAVFVEKAAQTSNIAEDWFKAGNRYYYAVQFSQDEKEAPLLYQSAMRSFSKGLKLDPKNTDARIMLASCFVEGSGNPMQGISMLREIEKTDSNNVKLQLNFAFFSVKSGQLDKALSRFKKVLAADSNYIEAYLHLADVYERQGNTSKTIEMLERYSERTSDATAKVEINKYIEQLKK